MHFEHYEDYFDDDDDDLTPARSHRVRNIIFALLMLLVMVSGAAYPVVSVLPRVLGYWNNSYDVTLTSIESGDCGQRTAGLVPTTALCVCGFLYADGGRAHFRIHLHDINDERLSSTAVYDQPGGRFCKAIFLDTRIDPGFYMLVIQPRLSRQEILRVRFRIESVFPEV